MVHRLTRRSLLRASLATAATAALAAPALGQGKTPINVANASGTLTLTMQELMKQLGFVDQFGLAANVVNVADGSRLLGGIVGGDIDLSMMSGFGQLFPAIDKGAKMKVLSGAAVLPSLAVFTAKPDIRTLKDLEGRTIATQAGNSIMTFMPSK